MAFWKFKLHQLYRAVSLTPIAWWGLVSETCLIWMFKKHRQQWCWWQRFVDDFLMVIIWKPLRQNHFVGYVFEVNRSYWDSRAFHQHKLSPTSVTNVRVGPITSIDITFYTKWKFVWKMKAWKGSTFLMTPVMLMNSHF